MMQPNSSARSHSSGSGAEIAVHAEDAVGDEQPLVRAAVAATIVARRVDVAVRKDLDRGAAQARAVDDAGVIQLVGDDEVVVAENRRHGAGICREAALKDDGGLGVLELRRAAVRAPCELPSCPRSCGPSPEPTPKLSIASSARLAQLGMRRQPEIVVRGEIDDRAMVERGVRLLLAVEHTQTTIETLRLERFQLVREIPQRIGAHQRHCFKKTGGRGKGEGGIGEEIGGQR